MSKPLAKELEEYGVGMDPVQYRELLLELKGAMAPSVSIGEFIRHFGEAIRFCKEVRRRVGAKLPDEVIARHLENIRKAGLEPANGKAKGKKRAEA